MLAQCPRCWLYIKIALAQRRRPNSKTTLRFDWMWPGHVLCNSLCTLLTNLPALGEGLCSGRLSCATLAHRWPNLKLVGRSCVLDWRPALFTGYFPPLRTYAGLLLSRRLRRWANIRAALGQRVEFQFCWTQCTVCILLQQIMSLSQQTQYILPALV